MERQDLSAIPKYRALIFTDVAFLGVHSLCQWSEVPFVLATTKPFTKSLILYSLLRVSVIDFELLHATASHLDIGNFTLCAALTTTAMRCGGAVAAPDRLFDPACFPICGIRSATAA